VLDFLIRFARIVPTVKQIQAAMDAQNVVNALPSHKLVADSARLARLRQSVDKDMRKVAVFVPEKMALAWTVVKIEHKQ